MSDEQEIQVVMTANMRVLFEDWLEQRGLYLFKIPLEQLAEPCDWCGEDLPTYAIGIH